MVAALYVETGGCYFGIPNVDPWDEPRDAYFTNTVREKADDQD